jgi:hypothetical protein
MRRAVRLSLALAAALSGCGAPAPGEDATPATPASASNPNPTTTPTATPDHAPPDPVLSRPGPPPLDVRATAPRARARAAPPAGTPFAPVHVDARRGLPTFAWVPDAGAPPAPAFRAAAARGPAELARAQLRARAAAHGLAAADVDAAVVAGVHRADLATVVRLRRPVDGLPVLGEELALVLAHDGRLVAVSGALGAEGAPGARAARAALPAPGLDPAGAVAAALTDLRGEAFAPADLAARAPRDGWSWFDLGPGAAAARGDRLVHPARARPVWLRVAGALVRAVQVEVELGHARSTSALTYGYVLAAEDGRVLVRRNLTSRQAFTYRAWAEAAPPFRPFDGPQGFEGNPHPTGAPDGFQPPVLAQALITLANVPFSRDDPWLAPGATETSGNNADAYADLAAPDGFGPGDLRASVTAPGVFDHAHDPAIAPGATPAQVQASVVQLFYLVNFLHDWFYDAGFDEAAGNAQASNLGRGGAEGDALRVEAQDASGLDNANMSTPTDGFPPRMQMFVWNVRSSRFLEGVAPARPRVPVATAEFGAASYDLTAEVAGVDDGVGVPDDACEAFPAAAVFPGRIALVARGGCLFVDKARNVQAAGASAMVVVNDVPGGPISMSGTAPDVAMPSAGLSLEDAAVLRADLALGPVTVRLVRAAPPPPRDGTLDGLIVAHEWGHYLSERLVGGGAGLFSNQAQGLGEGWADFVALLLATHAEDARAAVDGGVYTLATYAFGGGEDVLGGPNPSFYFGLRRLPYSTDPAKNPLAFRHFADGAPIPTVAADGVTPIPNADPGLPNSEVHNAGEVWASMLWECWTALLADTLGPSARLDFATAQDRMKRYLVASMLAAPGSPTLLEARDALLAVAYANDPADFAAFWRAFARRGAGMGATGPDRFAPDNTPVSESFLAGPDLAPGGVALSAFAGGCVDADAILDPGESALAAVTLRNVGLATVGPVTATVSSASPGVSFPDGPAVVVPASAPFGAAEARFRVALAAGAPRPGEARLDLAFPPGALLLDAPLSVTLRTAVDLHPASTAVETFEPEPLLWTADGTVPPRGAPWQRLATPEGEVVAHGPAHGTPSDLRLVSPPLAAGPSGAISLALRDRFSFESSGGIHFDGGVLEVSEDGGATWRDALEPAAYPGVLEAATDNPLTGRPAFVAQSPGWPAFQQRTLPLAVAPGATFLLRFRIGTDTLVEAPGWDVDTVEVGGLASPPFTAIVPDARACPNRPPVADAGADLAVDEGAAVTLAGAASDPDAGTVLAAGWTQRSGPAVTLSGAATATASFTAPAVTAPVALVFRLEVSDGEAQAFDDVAVTVRDVPAPPPPAEGGGCGCGTGSAGASLALLLAGLAVAPRRRGPLTPPSPRSAGRG